MDNEKTAKLPSSAAAERGCIGVMEMDADLSGDLLERRCYTVEDLQYILNCGRESVYSLLQRKEFRWIKIGGKRSAYRISRRSFDAWFDQML